jgi:hypothetical protein
VLDIVLPGALRRRLLVTARSASGCPLLTQPLLSGEFGFCRRRIEASAELLGIARAMGNQKNSKKKKEKEGRYPANWEAGLASQWGRRTVLFGAAVKTCLQGPKRHHVLFWMRIESSPCVPNLSMRHPAAV